MLIIKWVVLALLDWALLLTLPFVAPVIAAFTREMPYGLAPYTWGGWWGTYDNPPQGDQGFVRERCLFPGITTGLRGYVNRIHWMFRNPLYGYARLAAIKYDPSYQVQAIGRQDISDKYRIPGWYFAVVLDASWRLIAFEFYAVLPWRATKDLRMRLGWKVLTSKYKQNGFAPLVNSINPLDGYGND